MKKEEAKKLENKFHTQMRANYEKAERENNSRKIFDSLDKIYYVLREIDWKLTGAAEDKKKRKPSKKK